MNYSKNNKFLNVFMFLHIVIVLFIAIMIIAGSGVANDLEEALVEIKILETKGRLDNPPPDISPITKREIQLVKNSQGLIEYLQTVYNNIEFLESIFWLSLASLVFIVLIKLFLWTATRKNFAR